MYENWADMASRVSAFPWKEHELEPASSFGYARIYWKMSWTAVTLWNGEMYFADTIILFDEMINLVRTRYGKRWEFIIEREQDHSD
jgi:hypothetical protein